MTMNLKEEWFIRINYYFLMQQKNNKNFLKNAVKLVFNCIFVFRLDFSFHKILFSTGG